MCVGRVSLVRRLILLRHAKSSRGELLQSDFDRPLSGRGRRASSQMGAHLHRSGLEPDLILCSPSRRTKETLALLPRTLFPDARIVEDAALYHANAGVLLDAIRNSDAQYSTVMAIGHNPGMQQLAMDLAVKSRDAATQRLSDKFPTAAAAVYDIDAERWHLTGPECARLVAFVTPRDLSD
jgi:phosphohistidine phosphatase